MDFMDAMALGRDNAKRDRDRGGSTIRVFASTVAMHAARSRSTEQELDQIRARTHVEQAMIDAYEAVKHALFAHTWEGL